MQLYCSLKNLPDARYDWDRLSVTNAADGNPIDFSALLTQIQPQAGNHLLLVKIEVEVLQSNSYTPILESDEAAVSTIAALADALLEQASVTAA